jgi:hypothetical protein
MGLSIAVADLPSLSVVDMRTKMSQCDVRNLPAVELPLAGICLAADGEVRRRSVWLGNSGRGPWV